MEIVSGRSVKDLASDLEHDLVKEVRFWKLECNFMSIMIKISLLMSSNFIYLLLNDTQ